ncbi:dicer-like protein 4 isoform X1 [Morus notabilis]|uniref:dicer-like protein 4 isoform X1 n=1 Tax=Morus notabilis TaxID=981085 RepID=UPI000CED0BCB|nr:dicer-like protein 4 isoform X1 [Morus notabilis]XP_024022601.1 dicer-like protein 4 isoform X1 [Morus notabilis]
MSDGEADPANSGASSSSFPEKDPRKISRKYQLELCKKATEENIIVYLGTGCGKTHIAVLLIYELGHLIKRPQENICVFLAPTVALVQQQAKVIEDSTDFKVKICSGNSKRLKSHEYWEKDMKQYEVLVMIPQILVHCLSHCLMKMDSIALLIFDECHHAQVQSNHPYAEIMRVFYKTDAIKRPRIFGMTASPVIGKDASSEGSLAKSINSLESLLDAKVYSVEDKNDLDSFVATATVRVYYYDPVVNGSSNPYIAYYNKLGDLKRECVSELSSKKDDLQSLRNSKKLLNKLHDNIIFCLENLGLWGALQAIRILLNHSERNELIEAEGDCSNDSLCERYLAQAADVLASDCTKDVVGSDLSRIDVLKEPFFSSKLLRLIGILSSSRVNPNTKCIIFVNRIITARSLSCILQSLEFLAFWNCDLLVGINSGLRNVSRKTMKIILEKFRSGDLNLLIATKVGEEGLDIQTCCLVIRFDLPETVASFIQSRGRARMPQSEYAFLVARGNKKEMDLLENFRRDERQMNFEIAQRTSNEIFIGLEEKVYKVDSSGASISSAYSISLLHQYCSKLPHDEYFDPKPKFFFLDDLEGTVCHIVLPSNGPIHQIVSTPQSSSEAAKKDACLKAIEELHKLGVFNDYLLPMQDKSYLEGPMLNSSDSDNHGDEGTRVELHEMLVPALLKEPWKSSDVPVYLNSYYIEFMPNPVDRVYKKFGLFLKANLPVEAEKMELELHLARGRSVMTKLIPSGVAEFYEDEITLAEKFQEMFLKVILDRMDFVPEYVQLGKNDSSESSSSTFYLLLPVNFHHHENTLNIDWKIIRKCLSSPVFRSPENIVANKVLVSKDTLQLARGCRRKGDIENSLVYAPHKKGFFFIAKIVDEKNGHSPCEESRTLSYMEDLHEKFDIQLKYPEQPLLQAKPLFSLHNLLHNRGQDESASSHLDEYFIYLPPELCQLKIIGFSKDIGSSISLLPSFMQHLENLLVAIELKNELSVSFPEGSEVTVLSVLEALTTEKCQVGFSLERLEILGDAFLKYAVARHLFLLHGTLDEGQLTKKRSNIVNNLNLFKLACKRNLQVYIRDQTFDPCHFFALGRSCPIVCNSETEKNIHSKYLNGVVNKTNLSEVRCSKGHHWLHKKTAADVLEALIGAFIVDSGFKAATAFLRWISIKVDFDASQVTDVCIASAIYNPLAAQINIGALENLLGYQFVHRGLLIQAFVHPSYNRHGGGCYQRLEFLGDAVLDYLITSYLYSVYPKLKPGQLTDLRSVFVNNQAFANVAVDRSFPTFLISDSSSLSKAINKYVKFIQAPPSESSQDDWPKCPKALGDLVESCVGSILLDTGFNLSRIWEIMLSFLDPIISFSTLKISPIRELQELCQSHSWSPPFSVSNKGSMYLVEAKVNGDNVCASASATSSSTKEAKKIAAERVSVQLKAQGFKLKSSSLEEVLKSSSKMEAKLIGYDEKPIDVAPPPDSIGFENLALEEPVVTKFVTKVRSTNEPMDVSSSKPATSKQPQSNSKAIKNDDLDTESQTMGTATARSRLYEVCGANFWKPPLFECWNEGPGHLQLFTCKVLVEIEEAQDMILECFSSAHPKKKAAAEHAAEGALWFLKQQGYLC